MANRYARTTIFQWNCNGLCSKIGNFRNFLNRHRFPVLALSEPRLSTSVRISSYVLYQSQRPAGHGRSMLCVRKDLPHDLVLTSASENFEYVACSIRLGRNKITVASCYIAPRVAVSEQELRDLFDSLPVPFIVCGDFNAHSALWGSAHSTRVVDCWK